MNTNNKAQLQAISSNNPLIVCLAGPGSGKTRTITERIKRLILDGTEANRIVAITYTNAAAKELETRIGEPLGYTGTLHGFMLRQIRQHYGRSFGIIDDQQREDMIAEAVKTTKYKGTRKKLDEALAHGPVEHNGKILYDKAEITAKRYFLDLKEANLMDLDCVLHYGYRIAVNAFVPYQHLFVDEAQDAAPIDMSIYRALHISNKFWVGDIDQAVYSFRGGNVSGLMGLARSDGVEVINLEANYRSDQLVCRHAQKLIEHNQNRAPKVTASVSGQDGIVNVRQHSSAFLELLTIAKELHDDPVGSAAVLVRNNRLVAETSRFLTESGIQVATRDRTERPSDWTRAITLLNIMHAPDNDRLAYWWIRDLDGKEEADRVRLEALEQYCSINEIRTIIDQTPDLQEVPKEMAMQGGISWEMIHLVEAHLAELPGGSDIPDLIASLHRDLHHRDEIGEGVVVTTYHSAKGREWDVVYLPGFEQGVVPVKSADLEEERRLAFVAMTRARNRLEISHVEKRKNPWNGRMEEARPSQFIGEAGL